MSLRVLRLLIVVSLIFSWANLIPTRMFLQEVNSAFSPYYLAAHLLTILLAVFFRKPFGPSFVRRTILACFVMIVFYSIPLYPLYAPRAAAAPGSRQLRLLYANVHTQNQNWNAFRKVVSDTNPDIVALVEVNQTWIDQLALAGSYPYHFTHPQENNFGVGLYSRIPFASPVRSDLGDFGEPVVLTTLALSEDKRCRSEFVLFHALPPILPQTYTTNRLIFRRITTYLRQHSGSAIVAGDFNATPFSGFYGIMRKGAFLQSAMEGYGLLRTWNVFNPLIRLSIDHVMYRGALSVKDFKVLEPFGSDHLPLLVDFEACG